MIMKRVLAALGFSLCGLQAAPGLCASDTPGSGTVQDFSAATLAKVTPGQTTEAQVEALLGQPWRMTDITDDDKPAPTVIVWEYRGQDSDGTYRVHIEFDGNQVATLIAKIPDKTGQAQARTIQKP